MNIKLSLGLLTAATCLTLGLSALPTQDAEDATRAERDFARIKAMAGEWSGATDDGAFVGDYEYRVTAAGSAVMEIIFKGTDHEMLTVYHMEDGELVLTHYCALGNQPHMHAQPGTDEGTIQFAATHVSNLGAENNPAMKKGRLEFQKDGSVKSTWASYAGDEEMMQVAFTLTRKEKNEGSR